MKEHRPIPKQEFFIADHRTGIDLEKIIKDKQAKDEYCDDLIQTLWTLHSARNRTFNQWMYDIEDDDEFDEDDPDIQYTDWLGIDYTIDSYGDYRGVRLQLSAGGPNTYLDTNDGQFHLYHWGIHYSVEINTSIIKSIDEHFEEYWNQQKENY